MSKTVKLPKNIKSLESKSNEDDFGHTSYIGIFEGCSSLTFIKCNATTAPKIDGNTFTGISPTGTLYYPNGSDYSSWIAKLPSGWKSETF